MINQWGKTVRVAGVVYRFKWEPDACMFHKLLASCLRRANWSAGPVACDAYYMRADLSAPVVGLVSFYTVGTSVSRKCHNDTIYFLQRQLTAQVAERLYQSGAYVVL